MNVSPIYASAVDSYYWGPFDERHTYNVPKGFTMKLTVPAHLARLVAFLAVFVIPGAAQVTTTSIVDTIYRADGSPATGSLLLSWPEFTTAASQAVPAGKLEVPIGSQRRGRFLSCTERRRISCGLILHRHLPPW